MAPKAERAGGAQAPLDMSLIFRHSVTVSWNVVETVYSLTGYSE